MTPMPENSDFNGILVAMMNSVIKIMNGPFSLPVAEVR